MAQNCQTRHIYNENATESGVVLCKEVAREGVKGSANFPHPLTPSLIVSLRERAMLSVACSLNINQLAH